MDALKISNEPDPFLREIYAVGYNHVIYDQCDRSCILWNDTVEKRVSWNEWIDVAHSFKIIRGILPDGRVHAWLSEADGSAERFRKLIALPSAPKE
jgi:hypothetical protein